MIKDKFVAGKESNCLPTTIFPSEVSEEFKNCKILLSDLEREK
jgi:hypothetical protein